MRLLPNSIFYLFHLGRNSTLLNLNVNKLNVEQKGTSPNTKLEWTTSNARNLNKSSIVIPYQNFSYNFLRSQQRFINTQFIYGDLFFQ